MTSSKIFCCSGLEGLVANAGRRGLGALVTKTSSGMMMLLQSRGVDAVDISKLIPTPSVDVMINLACDTGMCFCPACGTNVQNMIKRSPAEFQRLADDHKKFQSVIKGQV